MKRLFEVTYTAFVMAETREQAEEVRIDTDVCDQNVSTASSVPEIWMDCIPFGSDNDETCRQYFKRIKDGEKSIIPPPNPPSHE